MSVSTANSSSPLKRLAFASTTSCASQASVYGKCVLATYTDVRKDICKDEFIKFAECLRKHVRAYPSCLLLVYLNI
ncbi:hypothetical protein BDQ17DRAFT_1232246 [Cyathus striatus]|nr:hypothetical protein BDQ17DRAFT_1266371 [Cyathus striatus]KAF9012386.1 hypothetical protein BDQ17DRAFT_1232246 [Cyathus striatus]